MLLVAEIYAIMASALPLVAKDRRDWQVVESHMTPLQPKLYFDSSLIFVIDTQVYSSDKSYTTSESGSFFVVQVSFWWKKKLSAAAERTHGVTTADIQVR